MRNLIRKSINEVVGVPENIIDSAVRLYEDIKSELKQVIDTNITEYNFVIEPKEPYKIGDMDISEVDVTIEIYPVENLDFYDFAEMGVRSEYSKGKRGKKTILLSVDKQGKTVLQMSLAVPKDWTEQGVIDYINKSRVNTVSSLTHELKHEYDDYKKPTGNIDDRAFYSAVRTMMDINIKPVKRLMFDLYYFTNIENLVRPSELAAKVKIGGVTRKEFRDFIKNEYQSIQEIRHFNINDFITELKNYIPKIQKVLEQAQIDYSNMSEDEIIEEFLSIIYITLSTNQMDTYIHTITDNAYEQIFGFDEDKTKELDKFFNKISKYKEEHIQFYYNLQTELNRTGDRMLRKLSKIYSLIDE